MNIIDQFEAKKMITDPDKFQAVIIDKKERPYKQANINKDTKYKSCILW